jgi:isoleucyl-tRNA synthetase
MLTLIAPILTYTADEIVENAPSIIKEDKTDIFDFIHTPLPKVESEFDSEYFINAREKFYEIVDNLKKEKTIKATLELVIYTNSKKALDLDKTEVEDWFVVSGVNKLSECEALGEFELNGDKFVIAKAVLHKCPRCWKYQAQNEEDICDRCKKVVS